MSTITIRRRVLAAAAGVTGAAATVLLAAPATAAGTSTVNVVHGIPGVKVGVCVDGSKVADSFAFGGKLVGASLPAGAHRVRLVAAGKACSAAPILSRTYTLRAGRNYTIVANLDATGKPNLKGFTNDVSRTAAGQARLTVRHTAEAPAVNVWANSTRLVSGTSFTWGRSATVAVPSGSYRAKVTLPGKTKAVIGPATLALKKGVAYQVYAVGKSGQFRLVTVPITVGTH